jgi:hypothetical protein
MQLFITVLESIVYLFGGLLNNALLTSLISQDHIAGNTPGKALFSDLFPLEVSFGGCLTNPLLMQP